MPIFMYSFPKRCSNNAKYDSIVCILSQANYVINALMLQVLNLDIYIVLLLRTVNFIGLLKV